MLGTSATSCPGALGPTSHKTAPTPAAASPPAAVSQPSVAVSLRFLQGAIPRHSPSTFKSTAPATRAVAPAATAMTDSNWRLSHDRLLRSVPVRGRVTVGSPALAGGGAVVIGAAATSGGDGGVVGTERGSAPMRKAFRANSHALKLASSVNEHSTTSH